MEQDYEQAVRWYAKAAAQGNARAQFNLGVCYENGNGVECDMDMAAALYTAAAEQGNQNAIAALERLELM